MVKPKKVQRTGDERLRIIKKAALALKRNQSPPSSTNSLDILGGILIVAVLVVLIIRDGLSKVGSVPIYFIAFQRELNYSK